MNAVRMSFILKSNNELGKNDVVELKSQINT